MDNLLSASQHPQSCIWPGIYLPTSWDCSSLISTPIPPVESHQKLEVQTQPLSNVLGQETPSHSTTDKAVEGHQYTSSTLFLQHKQIIIHILVTGTTCSAIHIIIISSKNKCAKFKKQVFIWGQRIGRDLVQVQPDKMTGPTQPPYKGQLQPKSHSIPLANLN